MKNCGLCYCVALYVILQLHKVARLDTGGGIAEVSGARGNEGSADVAQENAQVEGVKCSSFMLFYFILSCVLFILLYSEWVKSFIYIFVCVFTLYCDFLQIEGVFSFLLCFSPRCFMLLY
jgi:hypothetical protein